MKKITILTCIRNGSSFIEKSFLSVVNQDYQNIEYIIVDNLSTDNSVNIISHLINCYSHINITFKFLTQNKIGPSFARNLGIENSTGDYIYILDCDNYLKTNFTLKEISILLENIEADLILFSNHGIINKIVGSSRVIDQNISIKDFFRIKGEYTPCFSARFIMQNKYYENNLCITDHPSLLYILAFQQNYNVFISSYVGQIYNDVPSKNRISTQELTSRRVLESTIGRYILLTDFNDIVRKSGLFIYLRINLEYVFFYNLSIKKFELTSNYNLYIFLVV
jgi:glycosyltransferase involved in cell wall biosynthesis